MTSDLESRLAGLRAALRGEPPTDKDGVTAEGHITSAITRLERMKEQLYLVKK